jgi:tetratricopeptide (TPR) repeat protein/transcriptional regulator with XRE-family HTH domain
MSQNDMERFGDVLRHYRAAAWLTQEELAERAGVSRRLISDLERGIIQAPHKDTVQRLLTALHLGEHDRETFIMAAARRRSFSRSALAGMTALSADIPELIGRSHEMAGIERYLSRADVAQPGMLVLSGEPGIGKSRLLDAAARRGRAIGWSVVQGGCTRRSGQEPFAPFAYTLQHALAQLSLTRQRKVLQGGEWLARLLPDLVTHSLVSSPQWTLPPDQERRLLFAAIRRLLANLAGSAGTLLVLDDMQWAGEDALDLLTELVGQPHAMQGAPLTCICAYRSTEVGYSSPFAHCLAELAEASAVSRIDLGPLGEEEAAELLDHLLTQQANDRRLPAPGSPPSSHAMLPLPAAVRQQVLQRAEGMPFYLVSAVRELSVQRGGDVDGKWKVPWSVAQSVRARIGLLPRQVRRVLEAAAVIGREAPSSVLVPLVSGLGDPMDEEAIVSALETACDAGLLVEQGSTYLFAHDLIREVTLADLSSARARLLHRRVAESLVRLGEAGRARRAADIADHFLQAEESAHALPYLLQSGEQTLTVYAYAEAEHHFRRALELAQQLGDAEAEAMAQEQLGTALMWQAKNDEAFALLEQAVAEAERRGDLPRLVRLEQLRSGTDPQQDAAPQWVRRFLCLIEMTEARGLGPERSQLYTDLAYYYWVSGQYEEQLGAAEQALRVAEDLGNSFFAANARTFRGLALAAVGRVHEGLLDLEAALLPDLQVKDLAAVDHQQFVLNWLGQVLLLLGRTSDALAYTQHALMLSEQSGASPYAVAWASANCGFIAFIRGDWDAAWRYIQRGVAQRQRLGSADWPNASVYTMEGQLQLAQGQLDAATQSAEMALAVAQRVGDALQLLRKAQQRMAEIDLHKGHPAAARDRLLTFLDREGLIETFVNALLPLMIRADLELGEVEVAEALAIQTVTRLRSHHDHLDLVDALRMEAAVRIQQQRWSEAEAALEEALKLARAMPYPYAEARLLSTYGDLLVASGQVERAREHYKAALAILRPLEEVPYTERIQQALVKMPRH